MHKNQTPNYSPFPDLKKFTLSGKDQFVLSDTSTSYHRPFVPCSLRKSTFDSLHAISHPGIKSSIKMIKARFYWPHMDKTIKELCASCTSCQQAKNIQTYQIACTNVGNTIIKISYCTHWYNWTTTTSEMLQQSLHQSMSVCFNMYRSNQSMDRSTTYIGYYSTNRSRSFCKHVDYALWCSTPCHIRQRKTVWEWTLPWTIKNYWIL